VNRRDAGRVAALAAIGVALTPDPSLHGILGRRAGTLPAFRFSPAMVAAGAGGLVWTRETLDAYLANPAGFVRGTEMAMPGVPAPKDRRDVIDYLERASCL
jgi:cytochrome c2